VLSPLLANIALSALDDHFDRQWQQEMGTKQQRANRRRTGKGNWRLCRYADDLVLMVSGRDTAKSFMRSEAAVACAADRGRGGGWQRRY
jgi:RNA-directed DNA polymerase